MISGYKYKVEKDNFHYFSNDINWLNGLLLRIRGYKVTEVKKRKCDTKCEFATVFDGEPIGECHCMETWKKCDAENCKIIRTLVKTKDILIRNNKKYEVVIADDNIFVICPFIYSKREKSVIVKYNKAEIYANQSSINTLKELRFKKE